MMAAPHRQFISREGLPGRLLNLLIAIGPRRRFEFQCPNGHMPSVMICGEQLR